MYTIKVDKKRITITDKNTGLDIGLMLYSINKKLTEELITHLKTFRDSSLKVTDYANSEKTIELDEQLNIKEK
jgi:hypothetical protein